ncbi:MAG TPA: aldo/keto reductase [Stellaceae bacterium]|nr:aldo/keto reductase [Stellaceae bacterium]
MSLPPGSRFHFAGDFDICRVLNGMWQVSGAHGPIDPERALAAMSRHHEAGFTSWDLADHYGPAEDLVGEFRRRLGAERSAEMTAFTKWVPYPGRMSRDVVEGAVDLSRRRMEAARLDLLQFHWWEYGDERYVDALQHLADLAAEGKIRHLGLTNFDTERLAAITARGIAIVSNQVQYSLVDRRPEQRMAAWCEAHGVTLLAYGTLLGGLLSERYLGRAEPGRAALDTASLQKYKRMIDAWGGWALFQELLAALEAIADKHRVGIANVGIRYVLDQRAVAGVIVGARLGIAEHIAENARSFGFALDAEDFARVEAVLVRARDLMRAIGDCGDEYR